MNVTDVYLSRHEDVKELAERIGKDIGSLGQLTTTDKENIVAAINEIKQAQSEIVGRIEALEELHSTPADQGPADVGPDKDYPGTGWYKATDTGIIYNVGVPEGETHVFSDGNPTEYLSVYTKEDAAANAHIAATSNVTDLSYAFFDEEEYKSTYSGQTLSHWDVSNVTNFDSMFFYSQTYEFSGLENWKTSSATNMARMFTMANNFNSDISGWDVSNVTTMQSMFTQAMTFNQDISGWNVSNVENMNNMFNFANQFNQDLSEWCVTKIPTRPEGWEGYENIVPPVWGTCPRGENVEVV